MTVEAWAIPAAALVISVAAIVFTYFSLRQTASTAYVGQLEHRIQMLEDELSKALAALATATAENSSLRSENYDLLQRLFHATGGRRAVPEA